jgi:hypothetical protein
LIKRGVVSTQIALRDLKKKMKVSVPDETVTEIEGTKRYPASRETY